MKSYLTLGLTLMLGSAPVWALDQNIERPRLTPASQLDAQLKSVNPNFNFDSLTATEDSLDAKSSPAIGDERMRFGFYFGGGPGYYPGGYYPGYYYPGYGYGGWGYGWGGHRGWGRGGWHRGWGRPLATDEELESATAGSEDQAPQAVNGVVCLAGDSLNQAKDASGVLPLRVQARALRACGSDTAHCQSLGCYLY